MAATSSEHAGPFPTGARAGDPELPRRWRVLDTAPAPGAFNMGLDDALAESVRAGGDPVLRFYRWAPACLSLGRNQPAVGCYDQAALRARGMDVVRRPTGGRAVLHHRELTYSVVVPDRALGSARAAYALVNRALLRGLRRLGVPVELQRAGDRRAPPPSLAPCFRDPAEGEVVVDGRKLVGSAQVRRAGVLLQHGSLLLDDDQASVTDLLLTPPAEPEGRPATLSMYLAPLPSWDALVRALTAGWAEELVGEIVRDEPSPAEMGSAGRLANRYADLAWTWHK